MYVGMIETRSLKMLLKSFCENYSYLFKKQHGKNSIIDWKTIFANYLEGLIMNLWTQGRPLYQKPF